MISIRHSTGTANGKSRATGGSSQRGMIAARSSMAVSGLTACRIWAQWAASSRHPCGGARGEASAPSTSPPPIENDPRAPDGLDSVKDDGCPEERSKGTERTGEAQHHHRGVVNE